MNEQGGRPSRSARRPRKAGGARSDAERRRLAKAHRMRERGSADDDGTPVVWCDGGSRGNPGPAAVAFVIEAGGRTLAQGAVPIGIATAAVAEHCAVHEGLRAALQLGLAAVEVRTDSRLLVAQMRGEASVRSTRIAPLVDRTRDIAAGFERVAYRWVPESENGRAHALVDEALRPAR